MSTDTLNGTGTCVPSSTVTCSASKTAGPSSAVTSLNDTRTMLPGGSAIRSR